MKWLASFALALSLSAAALPALADVPNPDPCDGKKEGDACDDSGKSGTCVPKEGCTGTGCLTCDTSGTSETGGCSMTAARAGGGLLVIGAGLAMIAAPLLRRRRR